MYYSSLDFIYDYIYDEENDIYNINGFNNAGNKFTNISQDIRYINNIINILNNSYIAYIDISTGILFASTYRMFKDISQEDILSHGDSTNPYICEIS